ncbi:MAG: hypothetical protein HFI82_02805 [Eubacterium sp.]|jgi:hypothetical protein|nr:hypothetical protein [Eubacterium sp.]
MNILKANIWNNVEEQAKFIIDKYPDNFKYNFECEKNFHNAFDRYYNTIKENVMYDNVQELDRHKLSAIIICSIIQSNPLQVISDYEKDRYVFDGNEKIAVNIGLSYMHSSLKELLQRRPDEAAKFSDFIFPIAFMCKTDYISILCRNLCYAKKYYELNPVDLANTLFLIEYITLLQIGINPETMKQLCDEISNKKA